MAKTKFSIEITGLKINFEGEREDVPRFSNAIRSQVGDMLSTPAIIAPTSKQRELEFPQDDNSASQSQGGSKKRKRNSSSKRAPKETAINWNHDASRWGNPRQSWNPTKKALWLLFVLNDSAKVGDMSASQIATTFNLHFREAGQIQPSNVSRDLKKQKQEQPPTVQNDTTSEPAKWHLTEAGNLEAKKLVAEAIG